MLSTTKLILPASLLRLMDACLIAVLDMSDAVTVKPRSESSDAVVEPTVLSLLLLNQISLYYSIITLTHF